MKSCSKCDQFKDLTEFGTRQRAKDGRKSACKVCLRADNIGYYDRNSAKESLRKKRAYVENREQILDKTLGYYYKNKEQIAVHRKQRRENHPEIYQAHSKKYREKYPEYAKVYRRERRKVDPKFKIIGNLRNRLCSVLKYKKWNKNNSFRQYIGCSLEELKSHLENQFTEGMAWDNHGKWHIDHIIPLSSANTEEELYKLCHYTNLQPLWAIDNMKKSNKIISK